MYKISKRLLFLLLFAIGLFFYQFSYSYANSIEEKRNSAINLYKNGKINKALTILKTLSIKQNDPTSMFALGKIYLSSKNTSKALYWFNEAGKNCYETAFKALSLFYNTQGSEYFNPYKYNLIVKNCSNINNSTIEKPLIENILIEEKIKKKIIKNPRKIYVENKNLINEETSRLWGKIAQVNGKYAGHGSGFAILKNGYFLTNHHVIENCNNLGVRYNKMYGKASLINFNENLDIALLKVDAPSPYYVKFNSEEYIAGEEIFVAGFPLMKLTGTKMSINKGIITTPEEKKIGQTYGLIFISAPVASGNSGGPVINKYGELRGIVTGGMSKKFIKKEYEEKGSFVGNSTFNLMISGNLVKLWLDDINIKTHTVRMNASNKEPEVIGKIAVKYTAMIECYKK